MPLLLVYKSMSKLLATLPIYFSNAHGDSRNTELTSYNRKT